MAIYAEFDQNGVWQNTVEWDGNTAYTPSSGHTIQPVSTLPPGGAQGWTLTGSTWTPPAAVVPEVPATVAMWQAKAALQGAGLLTQANSAVAGSGNVALQQYWATAQTLDRSDPAVAMIGAGLSLTPVQIDALFIAAAGLSV